MASMCAHTHAMTKPLPTLRANLDDAVVAWRLQTEAGKGAVEAYAAWRAKKNALIEKINENYNELLKQAQDDAANLARIGVACRASRHRGVRVRLNMAPADAHEYPLEQIETLADLAVHKSNESENYLRLYDDRRKRAIMDLAALNAGGPPVLDPFDDLSSEYQDVLAAQAALDAAIARTKSPSKKKKKRRNW